MAYGDTGKILVADLTSGTVTVDEHDDAWYRKYMGGAAMSMAYILRFVPPKADPLGPKNVLVFDGGPLTGTAMSGQSRMSVNCKSPLSGLIGDAQVGRFFPAKLKMAGFDAVVVKGKSPFPVYLWIKDGQYELRDASRYWGMGIGTFKATGMPTAASLDRYGLDWAATAPGAHPLPGTGGLNLPPGSTASK